MPIVTRAMYATGSVVASDLSDKPRLCPVAVLTDFVVPAGQNYVVLNVAGGQGPTNTAAIGAGLGAVVAVLGAGELGSHQLTAIPGSTATRPKNLVLIRSAVTKDALDSLGKDILGLLQAENGVVQGDVFNDTTKQVQISFVKNNGSDVLVPVPSAHIAGKTIEYEYTHRTTLGEAGEDCNVPSAFFYDHAPLVPTPECGCQILMAVDNTGFTPQMPLISLTSGWLLNNHGNLLVAGSNPP